MGWSLIPLGPVSFKISWIGQKFSTFFFNYYILLLGHDIRGISTGLFLSIRVLVVDNNLSKSELCEI